ncbi:hypothetical protein BURK2_00369 [Burkholderiales bacterium]|nr:MAG: hypothetical protein F9K47_06190 [Burkholderiales bacterium]CAG0954247.1 hypothetical protein BURK2_00369 [Burkholderiales bacterium]
MRPHSISYLCFVVGLLGLGQLGLLLMLPGEPIGLGPAAIWIAAALATIASAVGLWRMRSWGPIAFFVGFGTGVMMLTGIRPQWVSGWLGQLAAYGVPAIYAVIVMPHWGRMKSGGS